MIDHLTLSVADYKQSKAFYVAALAALGYDLIEELNPHLTGGLSVASLGVDGKHCLWLAGRGKQTPDQHIGFAAPNRAAVDAFFEAALKAGGRDIGSAPKNDPKRHPDCYACSVLDPDGHNIEAICFQPA